MKFVAVARVEGAAEERVEEETPKADGGGVFVVD